MLATPLVLVVVSATAYTVSPSLRPLLISTYLPLLTPTSTSTVVISPLSSFMYT